MLPQEFRLKKKRDIEITLKQGKSLSGFLVTLRFWKIAPDQFPKRLYQENDLKIGFVVGNKISKSAVKRNRLKRQMREVIRLLLKEEKISFGHFLFFIAKKEMLQKEYGEIEKDMVSVLKRSGLLL